MLDKHQGGSGLIRALADDNQILAMAQYFDVLKFSKRDPSLFRCIFLFLDEVD